MFQFSKYFVLVIFSFSFLLACGTKKKLTEQAGNTAKVNVLKAYEDNILEYDQVAFDADLGYSGGNFSMDFNGIFRVQKDKKIWGSFKKIGFEVARVLITPDSIFVLNRFQQTYMAEDVMKLRDKFGVPLVFEDLQQMLLGASFWTEGLSAVNDSTLAKMDNINGEVIEVKHILDTRLLTKKSYVNSKEGGSLRIDYKDYEKINNASIAMFREISSQRGETNVNLTLKTSNFDFESAKSMPFEIPSNYSRQSF